MEAKPTKTIDTEAYTPRHLSFGENLILTAKLLGGIGLLGAIVWGVNLWMEVK